MRKRMHWWVVRATGPDGKYWYLQDAGMLHALAPGRFAPDKARAFPFRTQAIAALATEGLLGIARGAKVVKAYGHGDEAAMLMRGGL